MALLQRDEPEDFVVASGVDARCASWSRSPSRMSASTLTTTSASTQFLRPPRSTGSSARLEGARQARLGAAHGVPRAGQLIRRRPGAALGVAGGAPSRRMPRSTERGPCRRLARRPSRRGWSARCARPSAGRRACSRSSRRPVRPDARALRGPGAPRALLAATALGRALASETDWLPFLALITILLFAQAGTQAPRARAGMGRILASLTLLAVIALAFGVGIGREFTTFGRRPPC